MLRPPTPVSPSIELWSARCPSSPHTQALPDPSPVKDGCPGIQPLLEDRAVLKERPVLLG